MGRLIRKRGEFWGRAEAVVSLLDCDVRRLHATAPEHEVKRHSHEQAHFVFVPGGGYISTAQGAPELSSLPLLVINPAGTEHRDRFLHGRGAFVTLTVGGALGASLAEGPPRALHGPEVIRAARRLEQVLLAGGARNIEVEGLLFGLIAAASEAASPSGSAPAWLARAYEMIWSSDDPALSVAKVAASVGVHPVHLARVFIDYLGCAPAEALRGRRLERAAWALGRSRTALAEVAAEQGFADQSHLTRSFARAFDMTPSRFRRSRDVAQIQDDVAVSL
jgi:AraC family transcriptional regulator